MVVHLVNYDVDYEADTNPEKTDISLRIPLPAFLSDGVSVRLHAPGLDRPVSLDAIVADGTVSCSIPSLTITAAVVFSAQ